MLEKILHTILYLTIGSLLFFGISQVVSTVFESTPSTLLESFVLFPLGMLAGRGFCLYVRSILHDK